MRGISCLAILFLAGALTAVTPARAFASEECPNDLPRRLEIFGTVTCPEGTVTLPEEKEEGIPAVKAPPAAPAPGEGVKKRRLKYRVRVETVAQKRHFVGDEPVHVRYYLYVPFRARLGDVNYRREVRPFELVSVHVGKRTAIPQVKDIELQRITITVRLPADYGYGTYRLPALKIPYEYDEVVNGGRSVKKGSVTAKAVELEKVPTYVDVVQEREVGFIGDVIPFSVEIKADNAVEVLNEYPPDKPRKGIDYLSAYKPEEPAVLLGAGREDYGGEHYRVIRWRYMVAIHGIGEAPFELKVPQVVWRENKGHPAPEAAEVVHVISPDPIPVLVRSITERGDTFRPMKGARQEPDGERVLLLTVPGLSIWVLSGAGALWAFVVAMQAVKMRKRHARVLPVEEEPVRPKPLYDRSPVQRLLVTYRLRKVREEFQREPSRERCTELRSLLARRTAMRLGRRKQISVQEACAMTAKELEGLVGETAEVRDIEELDRQLETGNYTKLPGDKESE